MKVVLINRSDTQGGAAVVSLRLIHALRNAGIDAKMLVVDKQDNDSFAQPVGNSLKNKWNFMMERMGIFLQNGMKRDTLFKIDTATHGLNLAKHPMVKEAQVVMLAWINQGTLSLKNIKKIAALGKPIVWVMHDMWNATGLCHHAYDCMQYTTTCEACPLLQSHGHDLSTCTQSRKADLYAQVPIHFVAVSHWLESVCRKSSLMRNSHIRVIPNAFPMYQFKWEKLADAHFHGIPANKKIMVMGARRLDDSVKGFELLINVTRHIAQHKPQLARQLHLLLYGDIRDAQLLRQIALPYTHVGAVESTEALSEIYRHSDIVISTSHFETLPGTLIEGQASGCIPVTFGQGGQPDIVNHMKSGYIARYKSAESMAEGIEWAVSQPVSRQFLHQEVERKFSSENIAQQYIQLFNEIT